MVVQRKDTGHFVRALVYLPAGKVLLGYGSLINHTDYLRLWTETLKVPNGGVKQVTIEEAAMFEGGPHGVELAETVASVLELKLDAPGLMHPHQVR